VLGKTPVQIGCPADIGSIAVFAPTTENVNEAFHGYFAGAVAVIVGATEGRNFVNPAGFSRHRNSRLTRKIAPNRKRTHSLDDISRFLHEISQHSRPFSFGRNCRDTGVSNPPRSATQSSRSEILRRVRRKSASIGPNLHLSRHQRPASSSHTVRISAFYLCFEFRWCRESVLEMRIPKGFTLAAGPCLGVP